MTVKEVYTWLKLYEDALKSIDMLETRFAQPGYVPSEMEMKLLELYKKQIKICEERNVVY